MVVKVKKVRRAHFVQYSFICIPTRRTMTVMFLVLLSKGGVFTSNCVWESQFVPATMVVNWFHIFSPVFDLSKVGAPVSPSAHCSALQWIHMHSLPAASCGALRSEPDSIRLTLAACRLHFGFQPACSTSCPQTAISLFIIHSPTPNKGSKLPTSAHTV